MIKIHTVEQKSPEWYKLREQYPLTASNAQAIGNGKVGLETLCHKVLSEKYSKSNKEKYSNEDLERGNELEPLAREIYELRTGQKVIEIGFVTDDEISIKGGASPDGDVKDTDGLIEIKAFLDQKHFDLICELHEKGSFEVETKYYWQMQQQMLFTSKQWVDYCLFNPNYPESLLIQRVIRDEEKIELIRKGLKLGEILLEKIETNYGKTI